MQNLSTKERAELYMTTFPDFSPLIIGKNNRIEGIWIMGNNYTTKGDYGAYPHGYMKRISSMFPDCNPKLQLFSVNLPKSDEYTRFDINPKSSDVVGDAHNLSNYFEPNQFEIIYADPPYSIEDSEHYGTSMVNRNKIVKECYKILKNNGYLCWLDQVLPVYNKKEFNMIGNIGMVKSTNHRFRVVTIFQKVNE